MPRRDVSLRCMVPGLAGLAGYALYPSLVPTFALVDRLGTIVGESLRVLPRLLANGDVVMLVGGIVLSAICDFYAAPSSRDLRGRA